MKLKELVKECERVAFEEGSNASEILSSRLFDYYYYYSFSEEELHAIIQELSSCYGCPNNDLIEQLKEYHSELFED